MVFPNEVLFFPGGIPPEDKDQGVLPLTQHPDDLVGESLPAHLPVGMSMPFPHGEHRIEKQDTFLRPGDE